MLIWGQKIVLITSCREKNCTSHVKRWKRTGNRSVDSFIGPMFSRRSTYMMVIFDLFQPNGAICLQWSIFDYSQKQQCELWQICLIFNKTHLKWKKWLSGIRITKFYWWNPYLLSSIALDLMQSHLIDEIIHIKVENSTDKLCLLDVFGFLNHR